jgi:predicted transport protein
LAAYGVNVYKTVYEGEINPFKLRRYINVLLSQRGEKYLKMFFKNAIILNSRSISSSTARMVAKLLDEVKQPSNVTPLSTSKYYVIYRCDRAFTALALKPPDDNLVVESHVAYAECRSENVAYYYAAVLNYLAFKVLESERSFIRHQFARPLFATYIAGLAWKEIDDDARNKVVELSKRLHEKAPDKKYGNQQVALKEIASYPEFKELKNILDSKIDEEKLETALDMVSGRSVEDEDH